MATILLVDDLPAARSALRRILERSGNDLRDVSDFEVSYHQFYDAPADLVVADMLDADDGGVELLTDLRREYPDIKIVAVSTNDDCVGHAWHEGEVASLGKPFAIAQLPKAVERVLRRWH